MQVSYYNNEGWQSLTKETNPLNIQGLEFRCNNALKNQYDDESVYKEAAVMLPKMSRLSSLRIDLSALSTEKQWTFVLDVLSKVPSEAELQALELEYAREDIPDFLVPLLCDVLRSKTTSLKHLALVNFMYTKSAYKNVSRVFSSCPPFDSAYIASPHPIIFCNVSNLVIGLYYCHRSSPPPLPFSSSPSPSPSPTMCRRPSLKELAVRWEWGSRQDTDPTFIRSLVFYSSSLTRLQLSALYTLDSHRESIVAELVSVLQQGGLWALTVLDLGAVHTDVTKLCKVLRKHCSLKVFAVFISFYTRQNIRAVARLGIFNHRLGKLIVPFTTSSNLKYLDRMFSVNVFIEENNNGRNAKCSTEEARRLLFDMGVAMVSAFDLPPYVVLHLFSTWFALQYSSSTKYLWRRFNTAGNVKMLQCVVDFCKKRKV